MYNLQLTESLIPAQTEEALREQTIASALRDVATKYTNAPALVEVDVDGKTGRRWTYGQLLADSEKLALSLSTRFKPGEHVVVWGPNMPEWLLMEYACALAGLVLVTANPAYQANELRYVLEHSGAVGLFLVKSYRGNPMSEIATKATDGIDAIREIVDLEDDQALHRTGEWPPRLPETLPTDAAMIQYTSGTAGFSKGAVLRHRALLNSARFHALRCKTRQGSIWVNVMPLFHTSGCVIIALGCLQAACCMVLVKLFDPAVVNRLIESEKITMLLGVPTMMVELLGALKQEPRDVSSVELVCTGGALVVPDLVRNVRAAYACDFLTIYGQTEASSVITQHHHDDSLDDICNTIGQPLPQASVSIRRPEDNSVVPIGKMGEICVHGYCVMIGYHADAESTAKAIDREGWLHTGDLGIMDARGYTRVTGRLKDMIIRGGENHFPVEIENVILEHVSVAEAAVVGLPDDKWGEIIACFVRTEEEHNLNVEDLRRHCREHLAPQKTPAVWCTLDAFPQADSDKPQKVKLRDGYLAGDYVGVG